jgi:tetratricopeptide (TPR) repeat protein
MTGIGDLLLRHLDLALYVAAILLFGVVHQVRRTSRLKALQDSVNTQDAATQDAAHARLSALTGGASAGAEAAPAEQDPTSVQEDIMRDTLPGVSVEEGGGGVLTQYTAGDGQGVAEIEKMLEKDPENLQLLDWLAFMYYSNNDTEKAIGTYNKIIKIDPSNASQHYYLANSYYKANQVEEALTHWRHVVTLKPDGKLGRKASDRIKKVEAAVGA